jgi:hypothetical protein
MEFDVIDCRGDFRVDRVGSLPTWSSSYEGRMVYTLDTDRLHIGINSAWTTIAKTTDNEDLTATAAEINLAMDGITATAANLNYLHNATLPLVEQFMIPGFVNRPRFSRISSQNIGIDPGVYHHDGTTEQILYWDTQLTKTGSGTGSANFNYLYLDDSAIVSHGSPLLTEDEFIWNTTAPTWSDAKHGWYHPTNINDRCIFVIKGGGGWGGSVVKFYHDGGRYVEYDTYVTDLNYADIDTSWTNVTITMPDFGDDAQAQLVFRGEEISDDTGGAMYYRKDGSSGSGNMVTYQADWTGSGGNPSQNRPSNSRIVTVNSSQRIEVKYTYANKTQIAIFTDGWYLPRGI